MDCAASDSVSTGGRSGSTVPELAPGHEAPEGRTPSPGPAAAGLHERIKREPGAAASDAEMLAAPPEPAAPSGSPSPSPPPPPGSVHGSHAAAGGGGTIVDPHDSSSVGEDAGAVFIHSSSASASHSDAELELESPSASEAAASWSSLSGEESAAEWSSLSGWSDAESWCSVAESGPMASQDSELSLLGQGHLPGPEPEPEVCDTRAVWD